MSVVIETTLGDLTVDLFVDQRPLTCLNFLKLCKLKFYNFNLFHTIQHGFIAQCGDPTGKGDGGQSIWGILEGTDKRYFEGEQLPKIKHTNPGLLSMVGVGNGLVGSQFFFTLGSDLTSLDGQHCVIGEVTEGLDILRLLNETICDASHRPYQDVRITHTVILDDPFKDPQSFCTPSRSPSPSAQRLAGGRIAPDEELDETKGKTEEEISEMVQAKEAKARATILEIVGDLPDADMAPPENVLFVCKLNPVTTDDDLEIIFSRFGRINCCEVIRDKKSGDSLQYAFIEFDNKKSCEDAYFKMDNVLIDDRRIHVDFSQSVSKIKWRGKGRGVIHMDSDGKPLEDNTNSKKEYKHNSNNKYNHDRNNSQRRSRERYHRSNEQRRETTPKAYQSKETRSNHENNERRPRYGDNKDGRWRNNENGERKNRSNERKSRYEENRDNRYRSDVSNRSRYNDNKESRSRYDEFKNKTRYENTESRSRSDEIRINKEIRTRYNDNKESRLRNEDKESRPKYDERSKYDNRDNKEYSSRSRDRPTSRSNLDVKSHTSEYSKNYKDVRDYGHSSRSPQKIIDKPPVSSVRDSNSTSKEKEKNIKQKDVKSRKRKIDENSMKDQKSPTKVVTSKRISTKGNAKHKKKSRSSSSESKSSEEDTHKSRRKVKRTSKKKIVRNSSTESSSSSSSDSSEDSSSSSDSNARKKSKKKKTTKKKRYSSTSNSSTDSSSSSSSDDSSSSSSDSGHEVSRKKSKNKKSVREKRNKKKKTKK